MITTYFIDQAKYSNFYSNNNALHYQRDDKCDKPNTIVNCTEDNCNHTESSNSTWTTSNTSTSTETTNTSTHTTFPDAPSGTTILYTTAGTTNIGSTMTKTSTIPYTSSTEQTFIGIEISAAVVAVVVLVAVVVAACYYRRKKQSDSGTNMSMNNTGLYETHNEVFNQDNYDQIIRVTPGSDNTIIDRVYNNEEPEYLNIEE